MLLHRQVSIRTPVKGVIQLCTTVTGSGLVSIRTPVKGVI